MLSHLTVLCGPETRMLNTSVLVHIDFEKSRKIVEHPGWEIMLYALNKKLNKSRLLA